MPQLLLIIVLFLQASLVNAQKNKHIQFTSYTTAGILAGESPVAFSVQTVNGVSYNKWFLGAGFGLDDYYMKTLPLFASVRKNFELKKCRVFLYADAGTHFLVNPDNHEEGLYSYNTNGKWYLEGGAGLKVGSGKKGFILTVGNQYKNIAKVEEYPDSYRNETVYKLGSISVRAGVQL
ncbi:MAG: hypothetical protein V4717_19200 [Bacteroidota bacterium]